MSKAIIFAIMFLILGFKTLILDRIIMQRFVDEYDEKRHPLPYVIGKWLDQDPPLDSEQEEEDNENTAINQE